MNTTFLLLAEFGRVDVELELVAERYLSLDKRAAFARACRCELPFPAYRPGSQKSPWMVRVTDLASWLDQEHAKGETEWKKRQISASDRQTC